jgi:hypothetical protein
MFNLKVVSTFAILALSSLASADHCNSTGQKADQPTMDAIRTDLSLESICSSLIGDHAGKEERNTCIEIGGGKYDFTLRYKGDGYRNIAIAECKDGMKKELGCARGGKQGYGNWWYRYVSPFLLLSLLNLISTGRITTRACAPTHTAGASTWKQNQSKMSLRPRPKQSAALMNLKWPKWFAVFIAVHLRHRPCRTG